MDKFGLCPQPGCGTNILVVRRTGAIRRHSPRAGLTLPWCPLGGTIHPNWKAEV